MKSTIKTKIAKKFDAGMFSLSILAGFAFISVIAFGHNELAASFALAGLVCSPIGIAAERGFTGFLLNGILGQFAGVSLILLPNLGSVGIISYGSIYILYLGTVVISIFLAATATLLYKLFMEASKRVKQINVN